VREQTGNVDENKGASQEVESRESNAKAKSTGSLGRVRQVLNPRLLDYSTLNLKEQTGNVDENKGASQEVESRESNARAKSTGSLVRVC
jgi:hypothetical protein